jgi:inorganic pyrophosphatase
MARLDRLPLFDRKLGFHRVVVEAARGSRNKYKFSPELAALVLHKVLPLGSAFPLDFGFFPSTRAEDGDPLDVLVIADEPLVPGTVATVRLLGVIEARQTEKGKTIRNDRLVAALVTEKNPPRMAALSDVPPWARKEIDHFFVNYNAAEGRKFEVLGWRGPTAAQNRLDEAMQAFRKARKR